MCAYDGTGGSSGEWTDAASGAQASAGVANGQPEAGGIAREGGMLDALVDRITDPVGKAEGQTSGTRIKAKYLATADGARQWQGWYDSQRKEDCYFVLASDGQTRCLPLSGASTSAYFADAGCTQPIALALKGACSTTPPSYVTWTDTVSRPSRSKISLVGPVYRGTDVFVGSIAACTKVAASTVAASFDLYTIGAAVASTEFVAASSSVE